MRYTIHMMNIMSKDNIENNENNEVTETPEKKGSWADVTVPNPDEIERAEFLAKQQATQDNAILTIAGALVELVNEQRRINDYIMSGSSPASRPTPRESPIPERKVLTAPLSGDEEAIISYYKENILTVLNEADTLKTQIRVQENNVYIKFPWLGGDKFTPVGGLMRELGAEYVSAGKDTHFLAPLP